MTFLTHFLHSLNQFALQSYLAGQSVIVAVSGGPDSLCLLHVLRQIAADLRMTLHVATLDHGLRGAAGAADAAFVAALATQWGLPCHQAQLDTAAIAQQYGSGIEAAARQARYTFLARVARQVGARSIVTGHTADDQTETVLMHLLRGSGLAGLRGMLPVSPLSAAHLLPDVPPPDDLVLVRPLLDTTRGDIEVYLTTQDLQPRHDATNASTAYWRNRIRHELLPLLADFSPSIQAKLARTGHVLAADYAFLQAEVESAFTATQRQHSATEIIFDLMAWRGLPLAIRRGLVRQALHRLLPGQHEVSFTTLEQAVTLAQTGATGAAATLPGGITLSVSYETITLRLADVPPPLPDWPLLAPGRTVPVALPGTTRLPDSGWQLRARWLAADEDPAGYFGRPFTAVLALPDTPRLTLRTRRPGDRIALQGLAGGTQKIGDLLTNAKVKAAWRDYLPLLLVEAQIVWVVMPAGRIAAPFVVSDYTKQITLATWIPPAERSQKE